MKLFRRLLLSLFPEELTANAQHPVSMFLSLISPKQFFAIIHRRVTENFKLNLYDIALDPFEVKIGFGDAPTLHVKQIDAYYAYGCVAQLNGKNFFAPANLAIVASITSALSVQSVMRSYPRQYTYHFLLTVYLLSFVFVSKLRIFPDLPKNERYQWFIDVFFSFYTLVSGQYGFAYDETMFQSYKATLTKNLHLFFFLFYFYQKLNRLFDTKHLSTREFYAWLFTDELKNKESKTTVENFFANRKAITTETIFGGGDINMCKLIFPADIQIRYILQGEEGMTVIEHLFDGLYDRETMQGYLSSFLKDDSQLDTYLQRCLDRKHFHAHYFQGMKDVSQHVYRLDNDFETNQEIDSFISSLESGKPPHQSEVPERLKEESLMMDKLMNFYMAFVGGLWTGRGDSFGLRLFKKPLVDEMMTLFTDTHLQKEALQYYGGLLYLYSKNIFYYSYAYEHIRAGKEIFQMPYKANYKEVYSNMYLLKLFDESFVYTVLQDLAPSSLVITITQPRLVQMFRNMLSERIQTCVGGSTDDLIQYLYGPLAKLTGASESLLEIISRHITDADVSSLKEQVYNLDLHIWVHAIELVAEVDDLPEGYGPLGLMGIAALLRETLFGYILYVTYLQRQELDQNISLDIMSFKKFYLLDVLQISEGFVVEFMTIIDTLSVAYHPLLELWIQLDDNLQYFALGAQNRTKFIDKKNSEQIAADISGEDVVRCRGFLKSITYYNKRIVRPK